MSRRRLAVAAVLVAAAPALQGCGADDVASVDVAKAAQQTAAKQTARIAGTIDASGFGLPQALHLTLDGVTSLAKPELDLRTDAGPVIQQVQPLLSSLPLELRLRDGVAYVKVPSLARSFVPGNKAWASLDLRRLAGGALPQVDGAMVLKMLRAAGTLKPVGTEQIDGTKTTHLRGRIRLADQVKLLPAKVRARIRKALARVKGHGRVAQPVDVWVGDDGLVRREQIRLAVPAHEGFPAGRVAVRLDFSDFGTPLAAGAPAASETFDATSMVKRFAKAHHRR